MLKIEKKPKTITIAVPQSEYVQNFDTNFYSNWLRKETGYDIRFVTISSGYEEEYISTMLRADEGRIDALFLPREKDYVDKSLILSFAKEGLIEDLSEYVTEGTQSFDVANEIEGESKGLRVDDKIYFFPSIDTGKKQSNMQILWINLGWLRKLSLQIPETTEDFKTVLEAFKEMDPNGNGMKDELPLISNNSDDSYKSFYFLLNAFLYVDPTKDYIVRKNDDGIERGLTYCKDLYEEGLLKDTCNDYSPRQVRELINSPQDLVGAFTSKSIEEIVYPNCEDVLARYIQVPPLKGPKGEQNAIELETEAYIGGFIPANSSHKEEAFEIMDLMLSLEGSLISSFGEEDVDWRSAQNGELSGYGSKAKITTLNYLSGKIQNKSFAGIGPMYLPEAYSDAVAWNGDNSFVEYFDARAIRIYEQFYRANTSLDDLGKEADTVIRLKEKEANVIQTYIFGGKKQ